MRQKRAAVINDLSCYGRCSLTVQLPVLSAMNFEACPLPTALYSAHGAFPGHFYDPIGRDLPAILKHWNSLNLCFDGILCGLLPEPEQVPAVFEFLSSQKQNGATFILDPVLGDHGKFYSITTQETCDGYRRLLPLADVVVPNLTECCALLGLPYPAELPQKEELFDYARRLASLGSDKVVITGIAAPVKHSKDSKKLWNIVYEDGLTELIAVDKIGEDRAGTGDLFAALLSGYLWSGNSLAKAVKQAGIVLCHALTITEAYGVPKENGVCFEAFASQLGTEEFSDTKKNT